MEISINIWVIIFSFGFTFGVFLIILFLLFYKKSPFHYFNLALASLLMISMLAEAIFYESGIIYQYPFFIGTTLVVDLLLFVLLFFHAEFILGTRKGYHWKDTYYLFPFLVGILWQSSFILKAGEEKLHWLEQGISNETLLFTAFKFVVFLYFLIKTFKKIDAVLIQHVREFGYSKRFRFWKNTRTCYMILNGSILLIYGVFFNNYFGFFELGDSDQIGSSFITLSLYFIGILTFKNPKELQTEIFAFKPDNFEAAFRTIIKVFEQEKIYLKRQLSIQEVADKCRLTAKDVSSIIRQQTGASFSEFVNSYRIKTAKQKILKGELKEKTLLALALESGFNSKSSFNRVFKEQTGSTPSEFLKRVQ